MEELYWEWLCSVPELYRTQKEVLLKCFQTPERIWNMDRQEVDYLEHRGCKWINKIPSFKNQFTPEGIENRHREAGIQFVNCTEANYPQRLRNIKNYPYGLFFKGKLPSDEKKTVAVIGARMCSRFGKETAEQMASAIVSAGGQVISGAAYGIDGAAQWAALKKGGESFAVLGCGVDICYPRSHRQLFELLEKEGGILSEFPPGTQPLHYHFPMRNRIISGLSDAVAVVEARKKSGSLITAEFALDQGRHVLAVPGRTDDELSEGCNELINQGAELIKSVDSLIYSIFPDYIKNNNKLSETFLLAPIEKVVYSSLGLHSKSIWELEEATSLSLQELSSALISLELKGLLTETDHNCYAKKQ